ncbi:MAG: hypothetical protein QM775_32885 [Pirellulales bacterium]
MIPGSSPKALGIANTGDLCHTARDCLHKAHGDKVHAIRLYMHETGTDLERSPQGHRVEHGDGLVTTGARNEALVQKSFEEVSAPGKRRGLSFAPIIETAAS